jgi:hypothetical protein
MKIFAFALMLLVLQSRLGLSRGIGQAIEVAEFEAQRTIDIVLE